MTITPVLADDLSIRMGALAVPVTIVDPAVVTEPFLAAAVRAVAGAGAEIVDGAVTGTVVPAVGVAEVIDAVAALGALTAVGTTLDAEVVSALAVTLPAPPLVIAGTGVELTELFTASCGLAIGGTYCPVACSAISLL